MKILQNKDVFILAVVTLITVLAWIGFETYNTATKKDIPPQTEQLMAPITPSIRQDVLQKLNDAQP